ncbi:MAG: archease [Thermoplasmata archaeon]|nr:archease [Thermoplasmata archaeon]
MLFAGEETDNNPHFELFDHTADIGVRASGPSLPSAFEQAALGMYAVIFHENVPSVQMKGEYQIKLQATDLEQLLVDWLGELLYIFATEHIIFLKFEIKLETQEKSNKLEAEVCGAILSDEHLEGTREIKAVTYHMLSVKKAENWDAQVIFDI